MPWSQYAAYFTRKFWIDHVYEGDPELAKKDAENIFQRRDVIISTVLVMDLHAIRCLVGEVIERQPVYGKGPGNTFTSRTSFSYWEREGQRARRKGPAQFLYGVNNTAPQGSSGLYRISHFTGVV